MPLSTGAEGPREPNGNAEETARRLTQSFYNASDRHPLSLEVGRLFQASTTLNYIVANTAPGTRLNGSCCSTSRPGEGKSYANNVLNCQFKQVKGCIETPRPSLRKPSSTSAEERHARVMIDDATSPTKNIKALDKESNVIPNTLKNLLTRSVLRATVSRDANSGKVDTASITPHNRASWNTNTLGFVSDAAADRRVIMESEFPTHDANTQLQAASGHRGETENGQAGRRAPVQAEPDSVSHDDSRVRDHAVRRRFDAPGRAARRPSTPVTSRCTGPRVGRVSFCINQLVFAEAMKLACHFVFDDGSPRGPRSRTKAFPT
ncbi:hypothetical protein Q5P01_000431 [Channa striata]|uniref:Uncharacterized protein n=1 Tax=Channa striata TaxID=64152 RepID=A0AA88LLT2_CHASR|nr:hypothetical protein Q5P01_000431 [Channa striata]